VRWLPPILCCLAACNQASPQQTAEAAQSAVQAWAPKAIKGDVPLVGVECKSQSATTFRCRGDVEGGGVVLIKASATSDGFDIALLEPVVVSSLVEALIEDHLAKMDLHSTAECGVRVRPAQVGGKFKCAVEDTTGKVVNAAEVTIKDTSGKVDIDFVTSILSSDAIEQKIAEWLSQQGVAGKADCGQRHRFAAPEGSFDCSVTGETRRVRVTMTDYRANVRLEFAP